MGEPMEDKQSYPRCKYKDSIECFGRLSESGTRKTGYCHVLVSMPDSENSCPFYKSQMQFKRESEKGKNNG